MNIVRRIAPDCVIFGTLLLNDEDGSIMESITRSKMHDSVDITTEVFRRWFLETEDSVSWRKLVAVLKQSRLNTLASDIESMYETLSQQNERSNTQPSFPPKSTKVDKHPINSLKDLVKALSDIGDWEGLCLNLNVPHGLLSELRFSTENFSSKKMRCLEAYFDEVEASWEEIILALHNPPIGNKRIAKEIADHQDINYYTLIRDEL